MTIRAVRAMESCEVIIGYTVYVDLVKEQFPGKTFLTTPMTKEVERCEMALREAREGRTTAMICSGDAGVYGMAGLMHEIRKERGYSEVEIEVVPGITAATAGAAILGAPLIHDFAVISLSDLLTPWEKIEERLRSAAKGDFAICLYNPSSRKRKDYLRRACEILMEYQSPDTVCGYVRQIARDGEEKHVTTLGRLKETGTDMFTTVFIGNSQTRVIGEAMVTPRGYRYEKKINLIGIGTDGNKSLTQEAREQIRKSTVLIGAERMLESVEPVRKKEVRCYTSYRPEEIMTTLEQEKEKKSPFYIPAIRDFTVVQNSL